MSQKDRTGRVLPKLYQKIADLRPGSDNADEMYRDAIIDLHLRLAQLERTQSQLLTAIRKDLMAISQHAPQTMGAAALVAIEDLED